MIGVGLLSRSRPVSGRVARFGGDGHRRSHRIRASRPRGGVFARLRRLRRAPAIVDKEVIEAVKDGTVEVVGGVESLDSAGGHLADGAESSPT